MEGVNSQVLAVAVSTHVVRIRLWLMLSNIWCSSIIFEYLQILFSIALLTSSTLWSGGKAGSKLARAEKASAKVMSSVVEFWQLGSKVYILLKQQQCQPGILRQVEGRLLAWG